MAARTLWILFLSLLVASLGAQAKEPAATAPPAGRIEGRVLGPLGEPMRAVAVWAAIPGELDRALARGMTDGEGYFVLAGVSLDPGNSCGPQQGVPHGFPSA